MNAEATSQAIAAALEAAMPGVNIYGHQSGAEIELPAVEVTVSFEPLSGSQCIGTATVTAIVRSSADSDTARDHQARESTVRRVINNVGNLMPEGVEIKGKPYLQRSDAGTVERSMISTLTYLVGVEELALT